MSAGEVAESKSAAKREHYMKLYEISEPQIYGAAYEEGGYASKDARRLVRDIVDMENKKKQLLIDNLLRPAALADNIMKDTPVPFMVPKSVRTRQLTERVSIALQYGNSLLLAAYLQRCVKGARA